MCAKRGKALHRRNLYSPFNEWIFPLVIFRLSFLQRLVTLAKSTHRVEGCVSNDSRIRKAQGNARGRKSGLERAQTDGYIMHGNWSFFFNFDFYFLLFSISPGISLWIFTDSRQPKVVRRQLRIELFRQCTWHHVRCRHCIYGQSIFKSNSKGKPLKWNKSPFPSLTESVKLCKCLSPRSTSRNKCCRGAM